MQIISGQSAQLLYKASLTHDAQAPLIYLVHGRAGNYDVMWTFRRTIPEQFNIVAPQAMLEDPVGGFSWWQVKPVLADTESMYATPELWIDFVRTFEAENNLNPKVRVALGFSQGAGLLSMVLQKDPNLFQGIGLLAGFVIDLKQAVTFTSDNPKIFMAHGTEDEIISITKARESRELLTSWGLQVDYFEDPVGHKVGAPAMRGLGEWLGREFAN